MCKCKESCQFQSPGQTITNSHYTLFCLLLSQLFESFVFITDPLCPYSFWFLFPCVSITQSLYQEILSFSRCFLWPICCIRFWRRWQAEENPSNTRLTHCWVPRCFIWRMATFGIIRRSRERNTFLFIPKRNSIRHWLVDSSSHPSGKEGSKMRFKS